MYYCMLNPPLLQSPVLSTLPDIYFFFCGWHLLFSVYMCDSSPVLFGICPDYLFLGSSASQGKFAIRSKPDQVVNNLHCSTGSAGIIQTIRIFNSGHWVAGIFCIIATVGWTVQGAGNGWYYRQVTSRNPFPVLLHLNIRTDMATSQCCWTHSGQGTVTLTSIRPSLIAVSQAKAELATHGAKSYFSRES